MMLKRYCHAIKDGRDIHTFSNERVNKDGIMQTTDGCLGRVTNLLIEFIYE